MRQLKKAFGVLLMASILSGCLSIAQQYAYGELYSIKETEGETLEGQYTTRELVVHQKSLTRTEVITIAYTDHEGAPDGPLMFIARFHGASWIFPEYLGVSVNGNTFRLEENEKGQEVIGGGGTLETYRYVVPDPLQRELQNVSSMRLQVPGYEVIEIPEEGIRAVNDFVSSASSAEQN